jgi:HSP20 family protein
MTTIRLFHPRVVNPVNQSLSSWSDVLDRFFENDNRLDQGYCDFPKANIIENDNSYKIEMYVPGVSKSDIKIELENEVLKVSKQVKQDAEEDAVYRLREFGSGAFERRFTLPDDVKTEDIKADYSDGILAITLTKKEETKPVKREISIE